MLEPYNTWLEMHGPQSSKEAYGNCKEYVDSMAAVFPELRVRAGYYHCCIWGKRQHWWLETSRGIVVDPTAIQFPSKGTCEYEFLEEGRRPIGVCMNCGAETFQDSPSRQFCCSKCEDETRAYLMGGRKESA